MHRRQIELGAVIALLVMACSAALVAPGSVAPVVPMMAALVAAVFLTARGTAVVAAVAVVASVSAVTMAGYDSWWMATRVAFVFGTGVLAVVLAEVRVRRQDELRQLNLQALSNDLLRAVAESSDDLVFVKDRKGRYLYANPATRVVLGLEPDAEVNGLRDRDLFSTEMAARLEADDERARASAAAIEIDDVFEVDGQPRTFLTHKSALRDPQGRAIAVAGISTDVTGRAGLQAALQRSERHLRALIEATSAIVWRADPDGRFVHQQDDWTRFTAQGWDQHRGFGWRSVVHPDDRDGLASSWPGAGSKGELFEATARLWHEDTGEYRYGTLRAVPTLSPDGTVEEWLGTWVDVHEEVIAQAQMAEMSEVRSIVADAAARAAMADGVDAVMAEALAVLEERLDRHLGVIRVMSADDATAVRAVGLTASFSHRLGGIELSSVETALPSQDAIAQRHPLWSERPDEVAALYPELARTLERLGLRGAAYVFPLRAGAQSVGSISLVYENPVPSAVAERTRQVLAEVAPVVAHSLAQSQYAEMETEIAVSFQRSMLDLDAGDDPRLPLSVHYQAGADQLEAGGDWYDVVALPDDRIALMVGDVVGHSLSAATVMGRLRAAGRALLLADGRPGQVLSHLDAVAGTIDGALLTTCCCVIVDPENQSAVYSVAGHPPPVVEPPDGDACLLWEAQGPALALGVGDDRPESTTAIPLGSRLLLYTDGLVERRSDTTLDDGLARLVDALSSDRLGAVGEECARITGVLFADASQDDDVALICALLASTSATTFRRSLQAAVSLQRQIVERDLGAWLRAHGLTEDRIAAFVQEVLNGALDAAGDRIGTVQVPDSVEVVVNWNDPTPRWGIERGEPTTGEAGDRV